MREHRSLSSDQTRSWPAGAIDQQNEDLHDGSHWVAEIPFLDVVQTAQELVRIPSVNPMGREVTGEIYFEHRLTDYLENQWKAMGLPYERCEVFPGRDNLVTRLDGDENAETILLEVHQDTVPVDGMTVAPFAADLRDGRIYGRGACDIKGGMASMLNALARLSRDAKSSRSNVVLACTINEENGFDGAKKLRQHWQSGASKLLPRAPDKIIVAEPTNLNVVTAHKGTIRWQCYVEGRAAHSSMPELGDNAIYRMGPILNRLETYGLQIVPSLASHPLVGKPTLSVGMIEGGISVNTVPDRCTLTIDRRLLPNESAEEAFANLQDYLASHGLGDALIHETPFLSTPGLSDQINGDLAESLLQTIRECGHEADCMGVPYGTDADTLSGGEIPAVVFGPGDIAQAHTKDEWVETEQLKSAAEILYRYCSRS